MPHKYTLSPFMAASRKYQTIKKTALKLLETGCHATILGYTKAQG